MPRRSKAEVARRAQEVFRDFYDSSLSTPQIAAKHGISTSQVYHDRVWWLEHREEVSEASKRRPRKRKRQQICIDLWETEPAELLSLLNRESVIAVSELYGCSTTTIWRAATVKGIHRSPDGCYDLRPWNPNDPSQREAWLKSLDHMPRPGPSFVLLGNVQDVFSGRPAAAGWWTPFLKGR